MRELRTQKKWVEDYEEAESLTSDVEVLLDFFKEGEAPIVKLPNENFKIEEDSRFANTNIDKIRSGLRCKERYVLDNGYTAMYYQNFMNTEEYKKWKGHFNQFEYLGV